MDAFWAVPEWAPADESHLLGSSSVVTKIRYGKNSVTYSTFDAESSDVLRLDFIPDSVTSDGKLLSRRQDLAKPGYVFDESSRVLRIRHDARDIDIQGKGGSRVLEYVTFDDPHLAAGTLITGQYPTGVVDWGSDQYRIHPPEGAFATFNLGLADLRSDKAEIRLSPHRIFAGIDVYNRGSSEASVVLHSPQIREISFTVKAGELRRIRTGWQDPSPKVVFEFTNSENLLFDNLAYATE